MKWEITDGEGLGHILEYDITGKWHGIENLGHMYDDPVERRYTTYKLLKFILDEPNAGDWAKYTWIKIG